MVSDVPLLEYRIIAYRGTEPAPGKSAKAVEKGKSKKRKVPDDREADDEMEPESERYSI